MPFQLPWPEFEITETWMALLILVVAFFVAQIVHRLLHRGFERASRLLKVEAANYRFFLHLVSASIYFLAVVVVFYLTPSLRALSVTLFAGAGILAATIGFASQAAFSNIIGGIFIVIFKPFRVGDYVHIGPHKGYVADINLRHTVLHTFANTDIIIPNSTVSSDTVVNYAYRDQRICRFVEVTVSYEADLDRALEILQRCCAEHPRCLDTRTPEKVASGEPQVDARAVAFEESGIRLKAWAWTASVEDSWELGFDLTRTLALEFRKAGIEIPYPHRTVQLKGGGLPGLPAAGGRMGFRTGSGAGDD
jgi:small conductance mechanosensitive channel